MTSYSQVNLLLPRRFLVVVLWSSLQLGKLIINIFIAARPLILSFPVALVIVKLLAKQANKRKWKRERVGKGKERFVGRESARVEAVGGSIRLIVYCWSRLAWQASLIVCDSHSLPLFKLRENSLQAALLATIGHLENWNTFTFPSHLIYHCDRALLVS